MQYGWKKRRLYIRVQFKQHSLIMKTSICESLEEAAQQCDHDTISISFISTSDASNKNLNELDQSFMYTQNSI